MTLLQHKTWQNNQNSNSRVQKVQYGNPNVTKLQNSNKCKLKGAKDQNCTNSRVQKVKTTNSRVQKVKTANSRVKKYRGHGSCKISILLCSTSPFQNLEVHTSTAFAPLSLQFWPFAPSFHMQNLCFYTLEFEFW